MSQLLLTEKVVTKCFIFFRGMALCIIMMVSRIGSVAGSYVMGAVLFNNCSLMFGINAGLVLGKCAFENWLNLEII